MSNKKITIDEVKRIAKLSKLSISDEELPYYAEEMSKIINYFSILSKVDTSEIGSMTHVGDIENVISHDKSQKTIQGSEFLDDCPETFGRFIKVPKILDKD